MEEVGCWAVEAGGETGRSERSCSSSEALLLHSAAVAVGQEGCQPVCEGGTAELVVKVDAEIGGGELPDHAPCGAVSREKEDAP